MPERKVIPVSRGARWTLTVVGVMFVGVGAVGVFVPGLPTTVFLIGASWCFVRSCPVLEERLLRVRIFAPYMRLIDARAPMPRRARIWAMSLMWIAIAVNAWLLRDWLWLGALLVVLGIVGTIAIARWRRGAAPQPA
jgi:uncharacterized protein